MQETINMLSKTYLARCDDRNCLPRKNPLGNIEDFLNDDTLQDYNLGTISFDFFVNWKNKEIEPRMWIKIISDLEPSLLDDHHLINHDIPDLYPQINNWVIFAHKNKFWLEVLVFQDINWSDSSKEKILHYRLKYEGSNETFARYQSKLRTIDEFKEIIRNLSGGDISIGSKGLTYGTSTLECHLSTTNSLYPGDADLVLYDSISYMPTAIIEYKKHNLSSDISNETLSNYYPSRDKRKYDRLNLLRKRLNTKLIVLYYPTDSRTAYKLEEIGEDEQNNLYVVKDANLKLPEKNNFSLDKYIADIISFIKNDED